MGNISGGVDIVKNYYSTVDNIMLTFSNVQDTVQGFEEISVYFERPNENGFDFAEGKLPNTLFYKSYGFSEDELMDLQNYLKNNSFLIWEMAREAGAAIA